ncbi:hypothetical protein SEA_NICEHOUSE_280 [Rhodococcus phage NiceHouse]|nr:hypothetical protein SEA_NICEHOUSE_280 [Rhodococcus phage NiceHouse]
MQIRVLICRAYRSQPGKHRELMWYSQMFTDYQIDGEYAIGEYALAEYWDKTWQESISKAFARLAKAKWHWHNDRLSELITKGENDG